MSRPTLQKIYDTLYRRYGPQHWWPGRTRFEIIVGAILTQNTNWQNVEKAIRNLKAAGRLSPASVHRMPASELARLIRPSGYFTVKAARLKNFTRYLFDRYRGRLSVMARTPTAALRAELLAVNGIGPETADSILLYAFGRPVFVIDAYTHRFLYRHGLIRRASRYDDLQQMMTAALPRSVKLFNEYHALIVQLGKTHCRPRPDCARCPLKRIRYDVKDRCAKCYRWQGGRAQKTKTAHPAVCRECGF